MLNLFDKSEIRLFDAFVADYTNIPGSGKGVIISDTPFDDIEYFHFKIEPQGGIRHLAVNIEDYPAFKKGIPNCEAMFAAQDAPDGQRNWVLFLELKYCGENKIEDYGPKAISQMDAVRTKLAGLHLIDKEKHIVHFNYCSPNNYLLEPFDGFKETQSATLSRVEEDGVIFHARNMLIATDASTIIEADIEI